MIQAFTETAMVAYISTEDNRIDKTVASTQIKFLVKFINDLDGSVDYSYPSVTINNRYTKMDFSYNSPNPDLYEGQVKLLPAGHWKYEVYEVSWIGTVVVALGIENGMELNAGTIDSGAAWGDRGGYTLTFDGLEALPFPMVADYTTDPFDNAAFTMGTIVTS